MSLVPYTSSDISESEDEDSFNENPIVEANTSDESKIKEPEINGTLAFNSTTSKNTTENISDSEDEDSFNENPIEANTSDELKIKEPEINGTPVFNLPTPKNTTENINVIEEQNDEFLQKKEVLQEKKPVKIIIPSLSEYTEKTDTSELSIKKFRTASGKGTGLFSILPPPKNGGKITSLIPQSVQAVKKPPTPLVPRAVKKLVQEKVKEKTSMHLKSDEIVEDEEISSNDFFSLDRTEEECIEVPQTTVDNTCLPNNIPISLFRTSSIESSVSTQVEELTNEEQIPHSTEVPLDETALKMLIGSRGKRKRENEAVTSIIDLHETDIRIDNKKWFEQALLHGTGQEENTTVKAVPGGILKRKHQITYLAQQAKANEQQLKNTWAQNRATRQQTQSKYGF